MYKETYVTIIYYERDFATRRRHNKIRLLSPEKILRTDINMKYLTFSEGAYLQCEDVQIYSDNFRINRLGDLR